MIALAKLITILGAIWLRRRDVLAQQIILTYGAIYGLSTFALEPSQGRHFYLDCIVIELGLVVVLSFFQSCRLRNWLIACSLFCVLVNLAAWLEYPTKSIMVYSAYPTLIQLSAIAEVWCLLIVGTNPISRVTRLLRDFHRAEAKRKLKTHP